MPVRFTEQEVKNELMNYGYFLISKYIDSQQEITIEDEEGYFYTFRHCSIINSLRNNKKLLFVNKFNKSSFKNICSWVDKYINCFKIVEGIYINSKRRNIILKCLFCKENWSESWENILIGQGCPFCAGKRISKYNNLAYLRPDLAEEWNYEKNTIIPDDVTVSSAKKVWWLCPKGHEYFTQVCSRTVSNVNCPKCKESKGENRIEHFLSMHNIYYIKQYKFDDCRDTRTLKFNFAVFNNNSLCCVIEYDGEFHYRPFRKLKDSTKKFKEGQKRDKIKTKYCKDNNISLLRIPYWDFDNIEQILAETLL